MIFIYFIHIIMAFNPRDYYNQKAKKQWFKARAVYKLEQIDEKFRLIGSKTRYVLDLWCAPGSRLQYAKSMIKQKEHKLLGVDIKEVDLDLDNVYTYVQDMTDVPAMVELITKHEIPAFDVIISDAAPNTIGVKDHDAMASIQLIRDSLPIYEEFLAKDGVFAIKVFMGPWFDELVSDCKQRRWGKAIKIYKPDASRKQSKEIYIIKRRVQKQGKRKSRIIKQNINNKK